ncbi:MAG TPA: hypothetical protein VE953_18920, partial [Terriglobales bacterium]|nr:hypothetical protein [Terriglobales bacterium]
AMAPGVAGLVGAGAVDLWRLRGRSYFGAVLAAAGLVATGWWGAQLLARSPSFLPGLGTAELTIAVAAAAVVLTPRSLLAGLPRVAAKLPAAALAAGLAAVLLGPGAYAIDTVGRTAQGAIPASGPGVATRLGGLGGGPPAGFRLAGSGIPPAGPARGQLPDGGAFAPGGFAPPSGGGGDGGGASSTLIAYLERNQGSATWLVAVASSNQAAPIELASGRPVMAMGGFSGGDPALTVAKLQALVRSGQLRYVVVGGGGGPDGGAQSVMSWVVQHGKQVSASDSGTSSLYDLAGAA